jgi:predicted helicase
MSIQAIHAYHNAVHKILQYSGANHEQAIKEEFKKLLNVYCEKRKLLVVSEINIRNKKNILIRPDGIVKNILRLDYGYWESKANVNLDDEIAKKINAGYPLSNTLFQDDKQAVLYQNEYFYSKAELNNEKELDKLLTQFVNYESKEITEFNQAIEQFKKDLPTILNSLRDMIIVQEKDNQDFVQKRKNFLTICESSIKPEITINDINEMLIQHILTEEIFSSIFDDSQFHKENNIAKELYKLEETFFIGKTKRDTLNSIKYYYSTIKHRASAIYDYKEKQVFLKVIYENFYKIYNIKDADKQGIVYTPHEIVKFQIESVDYLLQKHFHKTLSDEGIKVLDPCTGTGTYICELIEHLSVKKLKYKYEHDIFANELGLLPYYIANLNIEYTYQRKMNSYEGFNKICWVDTLDNAGFELKGTNTDLFGTTLENTARIKEQNKHKISVIIGNPPYNANQKNENDNNKNREYKTVDARIKNTYIKESTAQKTKLYDMYARFYRWASDRISQEQGIIAFVTNNSFINSKTFDGFRKCIFSEFDFIYVINLGGDLRKNTDSSDNVFGITVGVALLFLVKTNNNSIKKSSLFYYHFANCDNRDDKLRLLEQSNFEGIESDFDKIIPDERNNWINKTDNDFHHLIPMCSKEVKLGKNQQAIFKLFSLGVSTNRDDWVYDFSKTNLLKKVNFFIKNYNQMIKKNDFSWDECIKWSRDLKDKFNKKSYVKFNKALVFEITYRPFVNKLWYSENILTDRITQNHYAMVGESFNFENKLISLSHGQRTQFFCLSSKYLSSLDLYLPNATNCLSFYIYDKEGNQHDNITDWALNQFKNHYQVELTKLDIFHYVYAVLHNPQYRTKYELNLKRDFPRIPFYENFRLWADIGKQLMELHLNYEMAEPYPLKRQDSKLSKIPKAKLKADKEQGLILIDDNTTLSEIPAAAWDYKLGNRSALEWILDQYKEKKIKDDTVREQFNTYRFADYKEQVIELLSRVCTVSVETIKLVNAIEVPVKKP